MFRTLATSVSVLLAGTLLVAAQSAPVHTIGATSSSQVNRYNDGSADRVFHNNAPRVGGSYQNPLLSYNIAVYAFELPDLGLVENPFDTVTFDVGLISYPGSFRPQVDVYGLAVRDSASVTTSMYFVGDNDTASGVTKIEDSFLSSGAAEAGTVLTLSNNELVNYLNASYKGGENIGKYIFLRLNPNATTGITGPAGYNLAGINTEDAALRPVLSYTIAVPESSTYALLIGAVVLGAVAVARRRRR